MKKGNRLQFSETVSFFVVTGQFSLVFSVFATELVRGYCVIPGYVVHFSGNRNAPLIGCLIIAANNREKRMDKKKRSLHIFDMQGSFLSC